MTSAPPPGGGERGNGCHGVGQWAHSSATDAACRAVASNGSTRQGCRRSVRMRQRKQRRDHSTQGKQSAATIQPKPSRAPRPFKPGQAERRDHSTQAKQSAATIQARASRAPRPFKPGQAERRASRTGLCPRRFQSWWSDLLSSTIPRPGPAPSILSRSRSLRTRSPA